MRFIKMKEVMAKTGLAKSTVYKYVADNKFPKSVPLSERSVAWIESEVEEWMFERIAERDEAVTIS